MRVETFLVKRADEVFARSGASLKEFGERAKAAKKFAVRGVFETAGVGFGPPSIPRGIAVIGIHPQRVLIPSPA